MMGYSGLHARLSIRAEMENKDALRRELTADVEAFLAKGGKVVQVSRTNEPHPTQAEINRLRAINPKVWVDYKHKSFEWHIVSGGNNAKIFRHKDLAEAFIRSETAIWMKQQ